MRLCVILMALLLTGCTRAVNDRVALGGSFVPPTLDPREAVPASSGSAELFGEGVVDRSRWPPMQFVAHFDGVVHGRTLVLREPLTTRMSARAYGRFPEAGDVLDLQARGWFGDVGETVHELGRSTIGGVFAVGVLTLSGEMWRDSFSPTPYKRTRQLEWSTGSADGLAEETVDE